MHPFDYGSVPLADRQIRILELLPSATSSQPVKLKISRARIDELPRFSALSYAWGDGRDTADITINEQRLSITTSLETALKALRSTDQSGFFWIDQISINQHDNDEKSRQIPLMGDIYSRSAQTIGWLGAATARSETAMRYLQDVGAKAGRLGIASPDYGRFALSLAEQADVEGGMVDAEGENATLRLGIDALIQEQGSLIEHPAIEGMIELCELPYFTRGWIQQEIAMPQHLVFQWGSQTIDADVFAAAIEFHFVFVNRQLLREMLPVVQEDPSAMPRFELIRGAYMWAYIQPSLLLRHISHSPEREKRLTTARVLDRMKRVEFSKPEDRVYGILGLVTDRDRLDLQVDVDVDVESLYVEVAHKIVDAPVSEEHTVEGINFLTMVNPARVSSLPSWVPDLREVVSYETLAKRTTALLKPYHASTGQEHEPWDTGEVRRLGCRGVVVDEITEVGNPWLPTESGERKHGAGFDVLSCIERFAKASELRVASDQGSKHPFRDQPNRLDEAKWRVPVLNRESVGSTAAAREATAEWSKVGWEMVMYTAKYDLLLGDIFKIITDITLSAEEEAQLDRFEMAQRPIENARFKMKKNHAFHLTSEHSTYQVLLDALKERIPFLGKRGFVGIGPLTMQPGDLVCVLHGGSFPFVLRKTGEAGVYRLVGEAYCDGIMAGEALHMDLQVQQLILA